MPSMPIELLAPLSVVLGPISGFKFHPYSTHAHTAPIESSRASTSTPRLQSWRAAAVHCAAKQRDELTAFQLIELHWIPASQSWIVGYRIGEDHSGGNGTVSQPISHEAADLPAVSGPQPLGLGESGFPPNGLAFLYILISCCPSTLCFGGSYADTGWLRPVCRLT